MIKAFVKLLLSIPFLLPTISKADIPRDSAMVRIAIRNSIPLAKSKLTYKINSANLNKVNVDIIITNNTIQQLKIPDTTNFFVGEQYDTLADAYFEVMVTSPNGNTTPLTITNDCDFAGVPGEQQQTLPAGRSISYNFNLTCFYNFQPDKIYKVRICFKLSRYNPASNAFSDWITIYT